VGFPCTRASAPAVGLRYGIQPKFFMPDALGGLPKGLRSNCEMGDIRLDFASSAQAPVVESDGEDRAFTIGLSCALFKRLLNDTSVPTRGFPGEYGEKTATSGEILGDWVGV
jgi:hypothetical protein